MFSFTKKYITNKDIYMKVFMSFKLLSSGNFHKDTILSIYIIRIPTKNYYNLWNQVLKYLQYIKYLFSFLLPENILPTMKDYIKLLSSGNPHSDIIISIKDDQTFKETINYPHQS